MDLHQVIDRVVRPHMVLIAIAVVISIGVAFVLRGNAGSDYTASARLVLDTPDPQSRAESTAIADTARAIATSPQPVRNALRRAGVGGRDPIDVAANNVGVRALGSSGVLQLSVQDRDSAAAAAIANALAAELIRTRLAVTSGEVEKALARFDSRIEGLSHKIVSLDKSIDQLTVNAASATGTGANVLQAKRNEAIRSRDFVAQQRAALESERVGLLSSFANRPKPTVISRATPPASRDPSGLVPFLALGGVLGLVLGLAVAGLRESVRPTLRGGSAIAKELHVPLLGTLSTEPTTAPTPQGLSDIGGRLRLAADAAGVKRVGIMARPDLDVRSLAKRLELAAAGFDEAPETRGSTPDPHCGPLGSPSTPGSANSHDWHPDFSVVPLGSGATNHQNGMLLGVVLVAPETMPREELVDVEQLVGGAKKMRLVGVIAYARSRDSKKASAFGAGESSAVGAGEQR
jgi:capsular polysaccharide biosynthesis protein